MGHKRPLKPLAIYIYTANRDCQRMASDKLVDSKHLGRREIDQSNQPGGIVQNHKTIQNQTKPTVQLEENPPKPNR